MNIINTSKFAAAWSTDRSGECTMTWQTPAGLLPEMNRLMLSVWLEDVDASVEAQAMLVVTKLLEQSKPFQIEFPVRCMDGTTRRMLLSGFPGREKDCFKTPYSGFIVEITEQQSESESALRRVAEYCLLVEYSTDLIAHCGRDGKYISVSPAYTKTIGWAEVDLLGQSVVDFLHPDDRESASAALEHIYNNGIQSRTVEVRKRHRDGHYVTLGTNACGVCDPFTGANIGAVLVSRDISQDKKVIQQLEKLAKSDTLTGLPNRAWIVDCISAMLARITDQTYTTVLFIDLNGFKAINDTMGHAAGDRLLYEVGNRLQRCMRPGDAVARLGGDEFVVAATCSDQAAAAVIASRILDVVGEPFSINNIEIQIGAAIGICLAHSSNTTVEQLFQNADIAMYKAKAKRRSVFEFF